MENKTPKSIFQQELEQEISPAQIELWPAVRERLVARKHPLFQQGEKMSSNHFRRAAFAALALAFAFIILSLTPQGQAFARELLGYFTMVSGKTLPAMPTAIPAPIYTLEAELIPLKPSLAEPENCGDVISPISSTFICQLQDAQAKLGFEVKSFPARYVQEQFRFMEVYPEYRIAVIRFSGYSLSQGIGDFPEDCPGCAVYEKAVQPVQVGAHQAEYVAGSFIFDDDGGMTWEPESGSYNLRWKEGERWYALYGEKSVLSGLSPLEVKEKMIQIAEDLASIEQGIDLLSAAHQPSIKDSIGFTLKEPGILPEGFQQVPDGSWSNLTTMPRVGMKYVYKADGEFVNALTLYQMLIPSDHQTLRREFALIYQHKSLVDGEWTDTGRDEEIRINGATGYYLQADELGACALYWRDDEREYLLEYHWDPTFGGRLDKEMLVAIAESLK